MIKQTHKPIQSTESMLINILRDMEAKHLKSATIYDRDSEEHVILSFNRRMHLILQRRTLPTKEQKMKQESRESRNLSMNQLKAKSSELYEELPRRNPKYPFERPHRNHLLRQINRIKFEQTLRRKGSRSQGVSITLDK